MRSPRSSPARPKLLYTVPTFQNPTGRTLPLRAPRGALAAAAERAGLWIVEDDPYGELRYGGEPIAGARVAARRGRARRSRSRRCRRWPPRGCGSAGCARRARCCAPLTIAKQAADLHSSTIDQAAAARWLASATSRRTSPACARAYGARRDALVGGLADALPPGSTPQPARRRHVRVGAAARRLGRRRAAAPRARARRGVRPGAPFFAGPPDRATLRLSFTTHRPTRSPRVWHACGRRGRMTQLPHLDP